MSVVMFKNEKWSFYGRSFMAANFVWKLKAFKIKKSFSFSSATSKKVK